MRFAFVTERATFIERPNRFLVHAQIGEGERLRVHCPDPGRLRELLLPGVNIHVSAEKALFRSTSHTLRFVEHPDSAILISLDSRLTNHLFVEGMRAGFFPQFDGFDRIETEVQIPHPMPTTDPNASTGSKSEQTHRDETWTDAIVNRAGAKERKRAGQIRSRIDFRLTNEAGEACWVEVKSATLVEDGIAYFPDAVTARGRRHLRELQSLVQAGHRAAVVFVVQRPDAAALRPQWDRDPAFSQALLDAASAGVECYACTASMSLSEATLSSMIPVIPER